MQLITRSCLVSFLVILLGGCAAQPVQPPEPPPAAPAPPPVDKRTEILNQLLARADTALAMQYLTEPVSGNAFDLYKAALRVDPGNQRATEGLVKVADAYCELIGESLRGKQFAAASRQLDKGLILFPGNAKLKSLEAEVKKARQSVPVAVAKTPVAGPNQFLLPPTELKAQSKSVETLLQTIAKRVAQSDESVLIFARSDQEGRWIYKTMRQAVGDYRIRGDIKIAGTPSVQLQAPIPR